MGTCYNRDALLNSWGFPYFFISGNEYTSCGSGIGDIILTFCWCSVTIFICCCLFLRRTTIYNWEYKHKFRIGFGFRCFLIIPSLVFKYGSLYLYNIYIYSSNLNKLGHNLAIARGFIFRPVNYINWVINFYLMRDALLKRLNYIIFNKIKLHEGKVSFSLVLFNTTNPINRDLILCLFLLLLIISIYWIVKWIKIKWGKNIYSINNFSLLDILNILFCYRFIISTFIILIYIINAMSGLTLDYKVLSQTLDLLYEKVDLLDRINNRFGIGMHYLTDGGDYINDIRNPSIENIYATANDNNENGSSSNSGPSETANGNHENGSSSNSDPNVINNGKSVKSPSPVVAYEPKEYEEFSNNSSDEEDKENSEDEGEKIPTEANGYNPEYSEREAKIQEIKDQRRDIRQEINDYLEERDDIFEELESKMQIEKPKIIVEESEEENVVEVREEVREEVNPLKRGRENDSDSNETIGPSSKNTRKRDDDSDSTETIGPSSKNTRKRDDNSDSDSDSDSTETIGPSSKNTRKRDDDSDYDADTEVDWSKPRKRQVVWSNPEQKQEYINLTKKAMKLENKVDKLIEVHDALGNKKDDHLANYSNKMDSVLDGFGNMVANDSESDDGNNNNNNNNNINNNNNNKN